MGGYGAQLLLCYVHLFLGRRIIYPPIEVVIAKFQLFYLKEHKLVSKMLTKYFIENDFEIII